MTAKDTTRRPAPSPVDPEATLPWTWPSAAAGDVVAIGTVAGATRRLPGGCSPTAKLVVVDVNWLRDYSGRRRPIGLVGGGS